MHSGESLPLWSSLVFLLFFITAWVVVYYKISRFGWSDFAEIFRIKKLPEGKRFNLLSGHFSLQASYRNALVASVAPEGFGLGILFPFRPFHPPLLIPWSNVTIAETRTFIKRRLMVTLRGQNRTFRVFLPLKAWDSIQKYCPVLELCEPEKFQPATKIWIVLWFALGIGFAIFAGRDPIPFLYGIQQHMAIANGKIIQLTPQDHGTVRYQFEVAGKVYQSHDISGSPNPQTETLGVSDPVTVFYDSQQPNHSMLSNPGVELLNQVISIGIMSMIFSSIVLPIMAGKASAFAAWWNSR